jgi:hypothetical protein
MIFQQESLSRARISYNLSTIKAYPRLGSATKPAALSLTRNVLINVESNLQLN